MIGCRLQTTQMEFKRLNYERVLLERSARFFGTQWLKWKKWIWKGRKGIEIELHFSLKIALNIQEKGFLLSNIIPEYKKQDIICLYASTMLVFRRVSPGKILVSFWTKYGVPCKIKLGIFELIIRRGRSNLRIVLYCLLLTTFRVKFSPNISFYHNEKAMQDMLCSVQVFD